MAYEEKGGLDEARNIQCRKTGAWNGRQWSGLKAEPTNTLDLSSPCSFEGLVYGSRRSLSAR